MTEPAAESETPRRARPAKPFGLPRGLRVLATREFKRIYAQGLRARGPLLTVVGRRRRDELVRVGLSVSKDHGPAVRRNKIKRILREAFRLERPGLPAGWDLVLIPVVRKQKLLLAAARSELVRLARDLAEGRRQPNRPR